MNTQTALNTLPGFKADIKNYPSQDNVPGIRQTFALRPDLARTVGPMGKHVSKQQTRRQKNRRHT